MALRRFFALLALVALCLVPAACGDDDSSSSGSSSDSSDTQQVTFKTTEAGAKVKVSGPKTIQAGVVELTFENAGKRPHDAQLLRVEGNHTAKETIENTIASGEGKPIPEWITDGGGVGTTPPGETVTVTQVLEPGTYYLFDTESSEGEGEGKPNALNGGQAKIEVTGETGDGELPDTDATITAADFSFEAEGVKPGANQVTFANEGEELHHLIAFPIKPGVKFAEVEKLFKSNEEPKGPPPVDFEKGMNTAVIDGGQSQVVDLEFQKGKYALVCFISNRKGGPPHVAMGMIEELDVK
jgi:plastocyanin